MTALQFLHSIQAGMVAFQSFFCVQPHLRPVVGEVGGRRVAGEAKAIGAAPDRLRVRHGSFRRQLVPLFLERDLVDVSMTALLDAADALLRDVGDMEEMQRSATVAGVPLLAFQQSRVAQAADLVREAAAERLLCSIYDGPSRDELAAMAMQGLLGIKSQGGWTETFFELAKQAYSIADHMIAAARDTKGAKA